MAYLGFARKYRPQKFSDLTGQEIVVKILQNSLKNNKISHAYVFSGPKGVGKTSTARILAKALNCKDSQNRPCDECPSCIAIKESRSMSVIEIDAASHTSVENIRDLRENIRYASVEGLYKVYIIDEAHMLSQAAFNAFLKTLEEPPPHVVFVLATTEPRKIPLTVLSRCQHLQFKRIPINLIKQRLQYICNQENINATEEALYTIASNSEGSMRDALTLLDQVTSFTTDVTQDNVNLLIGGTDINVLYELVESLIDGDREKIILKVEELNNLGTDFKRLTGDLINFLRNAFISKITKELKLYITESEASLIERLNKKTSEEHLMILLKELINAEFAIRNSFFPRVIFEITLLKLSLLSYFRNIDNVLKEIKEKIPLPSPSASLKTDNYDISLSQVWLKFMEKLERENHLLAMKIKHAKVNFTEGGIHLIYNGGASLYADSVRENLSEIKNQLEEFIPNIKITIHSYEDKNSELSKQSEISKYEATNHPLVKKTIKLFDGQIFDVIPKKGGNNV
ncbi:MAG: DNA polymerase III subunit gamma/tau [Thermodesulfovibrio sp.]|nr:DNA polymerase III subunit gamma/tau [Thermodesulfovibrio sp.]MDW7998875.1 DNA polymerase III subunit gamma/tau [Thermodesulfovibrio sp.]